MKIAEFPGSKAIPFSSGNFKVLDHYFVCRPSALPAMHSLFEGYLPAYYDSLTSRPEDAIYHHLVKTHALKVAYAPVVCYGTTHVCHKYCGHNMENTCT